MQVLMLCLRCCPCLCLPSCSYAAKVAQGYRPSQPKAMPDNIWALITACWQQDPLMRPHMSEVRGCHRLVCLVVIHVTMGGGRTA